VCTHVDLQLCTAVASNWVLLPQLNLLVVGGHVAFDTCGFFVEDTRYVCDLTFSYILYWLKFSICTSLVLNLVFECSLQL
jgi:hypothetical protein